jgi:hypothetical protein
MKSTAIDRTDRAPKHLAYPLSRRHVRGLLSGARVGDVDEKIGPRWVDIGSLGRNHIFSARTNLSVTVGASNYKTAASSYPGYQKYQPGTLGLPSYLNSYGGATPTLPIISMSSYTGIGAENNSAQAAQGQTSGSYSFGERICRRTTEPTRPTRSRISDSPTPRCCWAFQQPHP